MSIKCTKGAGGSLEGCCFSHLPPPITINLTVPLAHLLGTFQIKMAAHNSKHLICTILRNNRGLRTVYLPPIFLIKRMMACNSSGFCNSFFKCDRVVRPMSSPQPGGRTRGSQFVWSLHFTLFSIGGPTGSPRLQPM